MEPPPPYPGAAVVNDPLFYMIVYPNGDTSRVTVACMQSIDVQDYSLVAGERYSSPAEANRLARRFAQVNNLSFQPYVPDPGELTLEYEEEYWAERKEAAEEKEDDDYTDKVARICLAIQRGGGDSMGPVESIHEDFLSILRRAKKGQK